MKATYQGRRISMSFMARPLRTLPAIVIFPPSHEAGAYSRASPSGPLSIARLIPLILPLDRRRLAAPAAAHRVPAVFVEKGLDQIAAMRTAFIGGAKASKLLFETLEVLQGLLQELRQLVLVVRLWVVVRLGLWVVNDLRPYVDAVLFDFSGSGGGDRVPFVCAESPLLAGEAGFDLLASVVRPAAQVHVAAFFAAVGRALGRVLVVLGEPLDHFLNGGDSGCSLAYCLEDPVGEQRSIIQHFRVS